MIKNSSFSSQGKNKLNQDAILFYSTDNHTYLFAIADGMGGKYGGNIASNYSLNLVEELFKEDNNISIKNMFSLISEKLKEFSKKFTEYSKMGTTLTICIVRNNRLYYGHVGDCRIYHLRNEGIVSKTKDQTELQELLDKKVINKYAAKSYHRKNILLSVMSATSSYTLEEGYFDIQTKDRLLLLSDGVYNVIRNKKYIRDLSLTSTSLNVFIDKIRNTIIENGVIDDYSCIGIEIE